MARLCFVFLVFFVAALVTDVHSKVAPVDDVNVVEVETVVEEKTENDLEFRIQELRRKIKDLADQGKENERAFNNMANTVRNMDTKVKQMTERLRKINSADYLNAGAEEIQKL